MAPTYSAETPPAQPEGGPRGESALHVAAPIQAGPGIQPAGRGAGRPGVSGPQQHTGRNAPKGRSLNLVFENIKSGFQCKTIPGKLRQIDAGAGGVYGVNSNDDIYQWVDNNWRNIPGKLIHVSVGPAGVWGVNRANVIYKIQDNNWMSVSGLLKQVDAGGDKFLSGVNAQDNIYCLRQSDTASRSSAVTWTPIEGALKYYSCGPLGCWGVNSADSIYFRYNVNPTACQGTQWQQIEGALEMIEVGTDGSVYGVNSAGNVYRRDGISAKTPTGTTWTQLDLCSTFKHVTYDNGYLWLLNPNDDIIQCSLNV